MLGRNRTRLLLSALILVGCAASARAATLALDAPEGCVDLATLNQEVADLVGRPLADSPDTDFRLTIAPGRGGRWHLKLEASHRDGTDPTRVRELDAAKCAELADAAAVAIAVSVRALAETAAPPPPMAGSEVPPAAAPTAVPTIQLAPTRPPGRWRPGLTLSLAGDSGDLPGAGLGVMGGAIVGRRWIRLAVTAGWFPARVTSDGEGRFQLVFAAGDGCFAPAWRGWTLLACAGAELGAYGATGQGARPRSETTLWRAGRARLGTAFALTDTLAFAVNGTAVIPLARPTFVRDAMIYVYQSDATGVRIDAGLEVVF